MKLQSHTARNYAEAIAALLPPGAAWQWPQGGLGDKLLVATGQELARVDASTQAVLDRAVEMHRPGAANWHIDEYRRVAHEALGQTVETMPRKPLTVGAHVGDRLWGHHAAAHTFPVALIQIDHLLGPFRVGSRVGDRLWSTRSRFILRVRYYRSVVDPAPIWAALEAFKQAHVHLWFEDITGVGGIYAPH